MIEILDRISCSNFLFKFLDQSFLTCSLLVHIPVLSSPMDIGGSWLVYIYIYIYIHIYTLELSRRYPSTAGLFIALIVQVPWQKFCPVFVSLSGAAATELEAPLSPRERQRLGDLVLFLFPC